MAVGTNSPLLSSKKILRQSFIAWNAPFAILAFIRVFVKGKNIKQSCSETTKKRPTNAAPHTNFECVSRDAHTATFLLNVYSPIVDFYEGIALVPGH